MSEYEEHFGGTLSVQETAESAEFEFSDDFSNAGEVINCISHLLEEHSDNNSSEDSCSSDDQSEDKSDDEDSEDFLLNAEVANVIQQASNFAGLRKHLDNIKGEASLSSCCNLLYLKDALCLLSSKEYNGTPSNQRDVDAFLHLNNMQRVQVPGDGNCFFVSLATMIQQQLVNASLSDEAKTHLQNLGIIRSHDTGINQMAVTLRHTLVNEWLSNPSAYEPFLLSGEDYETEVNAFLQDGHFASELGNTMPLAAANALHIPVVVFTEMLNFPVLPICPRDTVISDDPIYLAHDTSSAGHYDAITQQSSRINQQEEQEQERSPTDCANPKQISCRCGQGAKRKKMTSMSCHEYKTGCKCFQNVMGCTVNCQCINCENPRGKKVTGTTPIACSSRKRRHHESSTEGLSGKAYTEMKAGGTLTVTWTLFEELVLMELMLVLLARDKLEPDALYNEYNHVVDKVRPTSMQHCLGKKTERQVTLKLSAFLSNQKVFETLMKEQVRLNFSE